MGLRLSIACLALVATVSAEQGATQSGPSATAAGTIRGVIRDAGNGKPIRGVEVRIDSVTYPIRPDQAPFSITDENGRYEIPGLNAGRYTVTASRVGFTPTMYGQQPTGATGRPVEVRSGSASEGIDISLRRGGVITVRVVDAAGTPVPRLLVAPLEQAFIDGLHQLRPARAGMQNVTDDRGEVRLYGLPPGEYYLAANPDLFPTAPDYNHVQTLYPGTAVIGEAKPIRLGPGEETTVTWQMVKMRRVRMSGLVLNSNGAAMANVSLQWRFERLGALSTDTLTTDGSGRFTLSDLVPGEYVLLRAPDIEQAIRLTQDTDGLIITAKKQVRVHGRIVTDGPGPLPGITALRLLPLQPRPSLTGGFGPASGMLRVGADGSFDARVSVGTGVLRLQRGEGGAGWFLKSIRIDGRDVADGPIDFGTLDSKSVEVVLTQQRGTVTGTVADRRAAPTVDCLVVVFPPDVVDWTPATERIALTRPDQNGRFELGGLAPGQYLLAAVDSLESGEERNPETLERLRSVAVSITLADGERRVATLRLDR